MAHRAGRPGSGSVGAGLEWLGLIHHLNRVPPQGSQKVPPEPQGQGSPPAMEPSSLLTAPPQPAPRTRCPHVLTTCTWTCYPDPAPETPARSSPPAQQCQRPRNLEGTVHPAQSLGRPGRGFTLGWSQESGERRGMGDRVRESRCCWGSMVATGFSEDRQDSRSPSAGGTCSQLPRCARGVLQGGECPSLAA